MSLIYEYGDRREQKGMKEIIQKFLESGTTLQEISKKTNKSIPELNKILTK